MRQLKLSLLLVCLIFIGLSYVPPTLTSSIYEKISKQLNNNQYFVIQNKLLTPEMTKHLDYYSPQFLAKAPPPRKQQQHFKSQIKIYKCDPQLLLDFCKRDQPLYLLVNTFKIEYNGRINGHRDHTLQDMEQDIKQWIQYRIQEIPDRMYSIQDIKNQASDHFEIFCYIDRQGEEVTLKEKVFLALAKKLPFLNFCHIDAQIAKELSLKQGHLALIRKNMTTNVDVFSEYLGDDNIEELYNTWFKYILKMFISDFRIDGTQTFTDTILVECDLSLECQSQLSVVMRQQKIWRTRHPQFNYNIRLSHSKSGQIKYSDHQDQVYDLPAMIYVQKKITKQRIQSQTDKFIDYSVTEYLYNNEVFTEDSVDKIITLYKEGKLKQIAWHNNSKLVLIQKKKKKKSKYYPDQL